MTDTNFSTSDTSVSITKPVNFGFDKSQRLLRPDEFKAVFDAPIKKIHTPHLLAFIGKSDKSSARLGLAITKKKLKKAVDRNRIKRITREAFRHHCPALIPIDVVLIVKVSYDREFDISDEVAQLFNKINKQFAK